MFGLWGREKKGGGATTTVALIGEGYRTGYVRNLLGDRVRVEAELPSDRRVRMLAEVGPEVVVLDCASEGVNPLLSLRRLAALRGSPVGSPVGSPRVVALTDRAVSRVLDADDLALLGACATADIRDPRGVIEAVLPTGAGPTGSPVTGPEPPRHRSALAGAAA